MSDRYEEELRYLQECTEDILRDVSLLIQQEGACGLFEARETKAAACRWCGFKIDQHPSQEADIG